MKTFRHQSILIICAVVGLFSCKKNDEFESSNKASISVIYAVAGSYDYKLNFTNSYASWSSLRTFNYYSDADYASSNNIAKHIGVPIDIPVRLKAALLVDTLHPIYDSDVKFTKGNSYTLILAGTADKVDTLLIKEKLPIQKENSAGIRFMNLSPDSGPVSINIEGRPFGSEYENIKYLDCSSFKSYLADKDHTFYTFEFRSVATGEYLGSYNFNPYFEYVPKMANVTLVMRGRVSGSPGIEIVRANNY